MIVHKFLLVSSLTWVADPDRLYPRVTKQLPDDVLLEIFVYVVERQVDYSGYFAVDEPRHHEDGWRALVHVCKRWRSVVFSSPRRMDLRLVCTNTRPVKQLLDIWPPLPIYIHASYNTEESPLPGLADLTAALEQQNRVCGIEMFRVPNWLLQSLVEPFPALTSLILMSNDEKASVLPDSLLGGSAPRLREIVLTGIPFPGIGKLLLSTTDLVTLCLHDIPRSGYISPEAMVASLSTSTRLEELRLRFRYPRPRAVRETRHPPPLTRTVLPALTILWFRGDSEYVEDIMSRIDVPLLNSMDITFFNQLVFDTPQLRRFISRTGIFRAPDCAAIFFDDDHVSVTASRTLSLRISSKSSDWQLSSLSQLYDSALSPLPTLEHLEIRSSREYWEDDMENVQWIDLLRMFPSVKDLILWAEEFRLVAPALDELDGEGVIEVLPALQTIVIEGYQPSEPDSKAIAKYIAKRQLLGCPVTVQHRVWAAT